MDLFQLTFLFGSIFAFQKGLLNLWRLRDRSPMDLGGRKVPMHLPTVSRHELTRLAQTGALEDLLSSHSANQALVKNDTPGGGVGMPKQEASAREVAARAEKVELLPTTVKVEGVQGKVVTREFKWPINDNLPPEKITALEEILDEF
jgi:hypothetical protein